MVEIEPAAMEKEAGRLSEDHVAIAKHAIEADGLVVLKNVIEPAHIEALRERMMADVAFILRRRNVPTNFSPGNIQQDPPPYKEFLFRDVIANDLVIQVTKSVLGPRMHNSFYSGNTNCPGSEAQPVHVDSGQLWPNLPVAHPAYSLVVNVPVVDMDERNGSTEVWAGTHLDASSFVRDDDIKISSTQVDARRKVAPPCQPSVSAGSVLIRDMRMWHRGMPNNSDRPRPMIAMIHNIRWWPMETLTFEEGAQSIIEHPDLITRAQYVRGKIDYLSRHDAYDVSGDN